MHDGRGYVRRRARGGFPGESNSFVTGIRRRIGEVNHPGTVHKTVDGFGLRGSWRDTGRKSDRTRERRQM